MKPLRTLALALAVGLLAATPCFPEYSLRVSATAEGGGEASTGPYGLTYVIGQAAPATISSGQNYTLSSGLVSLIVDISPPVILHSPLAVAVPDRMPLEITADIGDDRTGIASASVLYREGGLAAYRRKAMTRDGGTFSVTLPPSAVTEKGLAYYIEATDHAGNTSRHPSGAPDSAIGVRVWFDDLQSSFAMPARQYRMISLPGSTNGNPDSVLVDDLGEYGTTAWRLGRWNPSQVCSADCYDEYPDVCDFMRGRAFWLITKGSGRFDFSGVSTDIRGTFAVRLQKGWNQIGTPFAFTTDWLSSEIAFGGKTYALNEEYRVGGDTIYVEDNLISYDGTYHGHQSALLPWSGYWLYNGSTQDVDLVMSPTAAAGRVLAADARGPYDALLGLQISSPDFPERTSLAGLSSSARDGWDALDHREPPPTGDYLRLVFERPAWKSRSGTYMTDIRHSNPDGACWEFNVQASTPTFATLDVSQEIVIPAGWELALYDTDRGLRLLPDDLPYRFQAEGSHAFRAIAGTRDFIRRQEDAGMSLRPQIVGITPNPFRERVEILFFTPQQGRMTAEVFSVEGRLVKTLAVTDQDAGIHRITWNGDTDRQGGAATGLYFLRLRSGNTTHTTKVLKIQ
jgi:hypothetical protein